MSTNAKELTSVQDESRAARGIKELIYAQLYLGGSNVVSKVRGVVPCNSQHGAGLLRILLM